MPRASIASAQIGMISETMKRISALIACSACSVGSAIAFYLAASGEISNSAGGPPPPIRLDFARSLSRAR